MKTTGILMPSDNLGGENFWQLTWLYVKNIAPSLQSEVFSEQFSFKKKVFSEQELEQVRAKHQKTTGVPFKDGAVLFPSKETI
ncbi:hypothetical protein V6N11_015006 [Hibiscus sabdariffa]|uniref:Uncharacterized protein n=1 Tax=Hibiscus sabdariffa TaxID=183260 RepID=A0ABR2TQU6_9ROSI